MLFICIHGPSEYIASFPGRLPLRFLGRIHDLWTTWRSGRRPGITSTSSNRKVDSIMTYSTTWSQWLFDAWARCHNY